MIAALAKAGSVFDRPDWIDLATAAFDFVRTRMMKPDLRLSHAWREGKAAHPATVDDYANLSRASLALLEATGDNRFLKAAEQWLADARAGVARTRSGDQYKPSALRSYEQALRARILPRFGSKRLSAVSRPMLQQLVDELVGDGCAPSTVRNAVLPVRAIYRRALQRDELSRQPATQALDVSARAGDTKDTNSPQGDDDRHAPCGRLVRASVQPFHEDGGGKVGEADAERQEIIVYLTSLPETG